jgi:hypothetical protein
MLDVCETYNVNAIRFHLILRLQRYVLVKVQPVSGTAAKQGSSPLNRDDERVRVVGDGNASLERR